MEEECQGPNCIDKEDEKRVNGMEDVGENANHDIAEQDESIDSVPSPLSSDIKLNKRLRSKAWGDFIPIFVDGKVAWAECMSCHQVFNCSSSYGTSNLLKHQIKCASGTQKRPRLQEHKSLLSTQKSTAAASADPKQKKLSFLPSRQNKCLGTTEELDFEDTRIEKNRTNQWDDLSGSRKEVTTLEWKNFASDPAIIPNDNNKSHVASPKQNPTDTCQQNQEVVWNHSPEDLIRIFAMHGHLPRMMKQDRFRKLVAWLHPLVKMPSYDDLIDETFIIFRQEESKLKEKLTALRSQVCLSAYMWRYNQGLAFLCLSVHYVDDGWEKQQKIITFCPVDPSCNANELSNIILRAIEQWGLEGKVFSIILDDAFVDNSVASNVKARLQKWNKIAANRSLFVVRYATYLLDQVMQVGLEELDKFSEKSTKCSKRTMGPSPSVVQYPNCSYAPSREDWITAQKICEILGHFHCYRESMQNNPSPVEFYDKLWDVKRKIRSEADFYDEAGFAYMDKGFSNVLDKMQQKFKECWELCFFHFCMPMVMDPKHRLKHIKLRMHLYDLSSYRNLDREIDNYIHYVHDTLLSLFYEYSNQAEDVNNTSGSGPKTSRETFVCGDPLVQYYYHTEYPYGKRPLTELDQYLQEPLLATGESGVFQWWKEHSLTYPTIARMARDILALPCNIDYNVATRTAKIAMSLLDNRYFIEEQVCIQDWLKPAGSTTAESTDNL